MLVAGKRIARKLENIANQELETKNRANGFIKTRVSSTYSTNLIVPDAIKSEFLKFREDYVG